MAASPSVHGAVKQCLRQAVQEVASGGLPAVREPMDQGVVPAVTDLQAIDYLAAGALPQVNEPHRPRVLVHEVGVPLVKLVDGHVPLIVGHGVKYALEIRHKITGALRLITLSKKIYTDTMIAGETRCG